MAYLYVGGDGNQGWGTVLYTSHLNILVFIGFPLLTDTFQDHLGIDSQIVDGKVLWEGLVGEPITFAHITLGRTKPHGYI